MQKEEIFVLARLRGASTADAAAAAGYGETNPPGSVYRLLAAARAARADGLTEAEAHARLQRVADEKRRARLAVKAARIVATMGADAA